MIKEKLLIVEDEFIVANDLASILENAGYTVCATADTVDSAKDAVEKYKPTWVLLDIFLQDDSKGTELAPYLQERGIGFIYVSANTNQSILEAAKATQPYGFMVKPFREKDLLIMLEIARSRHESNQQFASQRQFLLQQQIRALIIDPISSIEKRSKIPAVFQSLLPFDYLAYRYIPKSNDAEISDIFLRIGFNEYQKLEVSEKVLEDIIAFNKISNVPGVTFPTNSRLYQGDNFAELTRLSASQGPIQRYQLNSSLQFCASDEEGQLYIALYNKKNEAFDFSHTALISKVRKEMLNLFHSLLNSSEVSDVKQLRKATRIQPVKESVRFEGIQGKSAGLLNVLDNIDLVAATSVSVLILGESGTGKEKVAYNIHKLSSRAEQPYITVNCAAMPAELIESELFGHEKGSFTGASEKRIGKFEVANGGTIFLDEIGEMPLDSQVKLLRVLQEKQFEPIGGSRSVKVDIRIVAATNRNLEKEVAEGRFRLDLFYRLNVYPIELPPLRDRKDDIPLLANYFLAKSATEMGRESVPELSEAVIKRLSSYYWPGNIRELQHLIERTLIKTRGNIIDDVALPDTTIDRYTTDKIGYSAKTLEENEIEHILSVLKSCNGKVSGSGGAAEILGIPSSTLTSRMKKLGIKKELYHDR